MARLAFDDRGISEIVGALMLILIVVIAAAGLAMIVSQAQKQQADRQAIDDAIKNEKLNIVSITPVYDTSNNNFITDVYLDVQNLNVDDSSILGISLNNVYPTNFYDGAGNQYNYTNRLIIPGSRDVTIHIKSSDFNGVELTNKETITIQIATTLTNFFSKTIKPPTANAKFDVESENLGLVQRDYIMLDGSDSSDDTGQIKVYQWIITDESNDLRNNITISTSGSKIRFSPPSNGPFEVMLTVKDDQNDSNAMVGSTGELFIPSDPNFSPPISLNSLYYTNNTTIVATLKDASGNGCPGEAIIFQPGTNIQVSPTMALTDANGTAKVNVSFAGATTGTVSISYEKLTDNIAVSTTGIQPNANFIGSPLLGFTPLAVQFADISTPPGSITSWQWNFGDGTPNSTSSSPSHIYVAPGVYNVILTVTNADGLSSTVEKDSYITANLGTMVADFSSNITIIGPAASLDVKFNDISTGNINSWQWNFGDGLPNSTLKNPIHTFPFNDGSTDKSYTVTLTVSNSSGLMNTKQVPLYLTANAHVPIACFTSTIINSTAHIVQFNDTSLLGLAPITYNWEFGDGNTSTLQNPQFTYWTSGIYMVNLTVTNGNGPSNVYSKTINLP